MNNKKRKYLLHLISALIIVFVSAVFLTWQITYSFVKRNMDEKYAEILSEVTAANDISRTMYNVDTIVKSKYIGSINEEQMVDYAITGYLYGLGDRYASYMNAEEYSEYLIDKKSGNSIGVGLTVVFDNSAEGLHILNVYEDSPAYNAGILPGEVITRVEGIPVTEVSFSLAVDTIVNGDIGDDLTITVKSEAGTERLITLEYDEIEYDTVSERTVNNDTGIIRIRGFEEDTPKEFTKALEKLSVKGIERYVLDIRNNAGGSIDAVAEMLDFLLPSGNSVIISHKNGTQSYEVSDQNEFSAPMAVLVNENTACEAEVFAAALQEYKKAALVGDTTYGKGMIQDTVKLPGGGAASISVSEYLTPSGAKIEGKGVKPEYAAYLTEQVKQKFYTMTDEEDSQLQSALSVVKTMEITIIQ